MLPFHQTPECSSLWGTGHMTARGPDVEVGIQATRSRVIPGHWVLRVRRFGRGLGPERTGQALSALKELALKEPVLRLHVEIWTEDDAEREMISRSCEERGFRDVPMHSYRRTLWMDLGASEEDLFMSLHKTARQNIRAVRKYPVQVRPVTEVSLAGRLDALCQQALDRTGGVHEPTNWPEWIRLAQAQPSRVHIVGMFRTDQTGPESLISHAISVHHGEVAEYSIAGSSRPPDLKVPLLYAPTWDLILWAKRQGAVWWDFGGVTFTAGSGEPDPRAGITGFKRYFCRDVVEVGREFVFVPSPVKARAADLAGAVIDRLRRS